MVSTVKSRILGPRDDNSRRGGVVNMILKKSDMILCLGEAYPVDLKKGMRDSEGGGRKGRGFWGGF